MVKPITVKDLILALHGKPLDAEVRIKKNDKYIEKCNLVIIEPDSLGCLFG